MTDLKTYLKGLIFMGIFVLLQIPLLKMDIDIQDFHNPVNYILWFIPFYIVIYYYRNIYRYRYMSILSLYIILPMLFTLLYTYINLGIDRDSLLAYMEVSYVASFIVLTVAFMVSIFLPSPHPEIKRPVKISEETKKLRREYIRSKYF